MAKTAVNTLVSRIKSRIDYNITDSDLDALVLEVLNDVAKLIKQDLTDYGLWKETPTQANFRLIADQNYMDLRTARIVGDASTFTPVAGDTITVTIDGTATNVAMAGCTTIALVVTAINTAVGSTVASSSTDGYLALTSLSTGTTSSVAISDSAGTPSTRLFTDSTERSRNGISDIDEVIAVTERTNGTSIKIISFKDFLDRYPDPSDSSSDVPDEVAFANNRIYSGPTPSTDTLMYIDYIKLITAITAGSSMPFDDKYDPLFLAWSREELLMYLDSKDTASISAARAIREDWEKRLIINASNNMSMDRQAKRRTEEDEPDINPRMVK